MNITATPLHPLFAAEFSGAQALGSLDRQTVDEIRALMDRYAVGVLRHPYIVPEEEHIAFSRLFGPMQSTPIITVRNDSGARLPPPEINDVGNIDRDGNIFPENDRRLLYKRANQLWHTDVSFMPVRATRLSVASPGSA